MTNANEFGVLIVLMCRLGALFVLEQPESYAMLIEC